MASVVFLAGCAFDVVSVHQVPVTFVRSEPVANGEYTLEKDLTASIGTGFETRLRQGTHWHCVGQTEYGCVYSTSDQIVTVEASNIYEAQAVLSGRNLAGFYLPVEKKFVPIKQPLAFETTPEIPIPK